MTYEERERWVMNYEPLYMAWKKSHLTIEDFIRIFRATIDATIKANLQKEPS
jgi:hypothetical protein